MRRAAIYVLALVFLPVMSALMLVMPFVVLFCLPIWTVMYLLDMLKERPSITPWDMAKDMLLFPYEMWRDLID